MEWSPYRQIIWTNGQPRQGPWLSNWTCRGCRGGHATGSHPNYVPTLWQRTPASSWALPWCVCGVNRLHPMLLHYPELDTDPDEAWVPAWHCTTYGMQEGEHSRHTFGAARHQMIAETLTPQQWELLQLTDIPGGPEEFVESITLHALSHANRQGSAVRRDWMRATPPTPEWKRRAPEGTWTMKGPCRAGRFASSCKGRGGRTPPPIAASSAKTSGSQSPPRPPSVAPRGGKPLARGAATRGTHQVQTGEGGTPSHPPVRPLGRSSGEQRSRGVCRPWGGWAPQHRTPA